MTMKQKRKLTNLFLYIFLIACAGVFLVPLLIMVLGSFKNSIEVTAVIWKLCTGIQQGFYTCCCEQFDDYRSKCYN